MKRELLETAHADEVVDFLEERIVVVHMYRAASPEVGRDNFGEDSLTEGRHMCDWCC